MCALGRCRKCSRSLLFIKKESYKSLLALTRDLILKILNSEDFGYYTKKSS